MNFSFFETDVSHLRTPVRCRPRICSRQYINTQLMHVTFYSSEDVTPHYSQYTVYCDTSGFYLHAKNRFFVVQVLRPASVYFCPDRFCFFGRLSLLTALSKVALVVRKYNFRFILRFAPKNMRAQPQSGRKKVFIFPLNFLRIERAPWRQTARYPFSFGPSVVAATTSSDHPVWHHNMQPRR